MKQNPLENPIICEVHRQTAIFIKLHENNPYEKFPCQLCVLEYYQKVCSCQPIEQFQNIQPTQNKPSKLLLNVMDEIFQLKQLANIYFNNINQTINQLCKFITEEKETIQILKRELNQAHNFQERRLHALEFFNSTKNNLLQQVSVLTKTLKSETFLQVMNELEVDTLLKYDVDLNTKQIELKSEDQSLYQLIPYTKTETGDECFSLKFNDIGSLLLIGCNKVIKIMKYENKRLELIQEVESTTNFVNCLTFMDNLNQFAAGSLNSLSIWQEFSSNKWELRQQLQNQKQLINSIVFCKKDNTLITGGEDKSIQILKFENQSWQVNQRIECNSYILTLNINEEQDLLVCILAKKQIVIFKPQNYQWIIIQKIESESQVNKLCFIENYNFALQQENGQVIEIFYYNEEENKVQIEKNIQIIEGFYDCFNFPLFYIRSKQLLLAKSGNILNIFQKMDQDDFINQQKINFRTNIFYGDVSKDTNYLALWDKQTYLIQVLELQQ